VDTWVVLVCKIQFLEHHNITQAVVVVELMVYVPVTQGGSAAAAREVEAPSAHQELLILVGVEEVERTPQLILEAGPVGLV
jgi:hypothetical protein